MKQFLFIATILLAFCSCQKNYNKMIEDKVRKCQSEGMIIFSQSHNANEKEHYLVYGDPSRQIMYVDDLGDSIKEIQLGEKREWQPDLYASANEGLQIINSHERYAQAENSAAADGFPTYNPVLHLNVDGKIDFTNGKWHENSSSIDVTFYKDKYLVCSLPPSSIDSNLKPQIVLFFNKPDFYYWLDDANINQQTGDIDVSCGTSILTMLNDYWRDLLDNDNVYIDRNHEDGVYKFSLSPNGDVINKSKDFVANGFIHIPVEAFSSFDTLLPYLKRLSSN